MESTLDPGRETRRAVALDRDVSAIALALEHSSVGVFDFDLATGTLRFSSRCKTLWGLSREAEPSLEQLLALVHPEDRALVQETMGSEGIEQALSFDIEYRVSLPNGTLRWHRASGRAVQDGTGALRRVARRIGTMRDVTESRLMREALQQSEERLQAALEAADLGTWDLDLITDRSAARSLRHDQMFGYSEPQLEWGQQIAERHVIDEDKAVFRAAFERAARTGVLDVEFRVRWPDGSIHWIAPRGRTYYDATGTPVRMAGVVADVTARRRAEAQLSESETKYRTLFESIGQGYALCELIRDQAGTAVDYEYLEINPAWQSFTGLARDAVIGRRRNELFPVQDGNMLRLYAEVVGEQHRVRFERHVAATGRWYDVTAFPRGGERFAVLYEDITERKEAEAALQQADRRKDEFIATLAHELRNPLAPLRNGLHIARLIGRSEPALERNIEMMDRQLSHLVRLVDDLLDVGRISSGKLELRRRAVALQEIVANSIESTRVLIEAREHELVVDIEDGSCMVNGDFERLTQVFNNLLTNAAKYTEPRGRITLTLRRHDGVADVSVRDTGVGIPPDDIHSVFELFCQVRSHQGYAGGGLGIGLSIARRIVQMHGGAIEAASAGLGLGSTFTVHLPLVDSTRHAQSSEGRAESAGLAPEHRLRVLVVDDNVEAADSLAALLLLMGHEAGVAYGGLEALQRVQDRPPDLVLLDLGMPDIDGLETARRIRAMPGLASLPIAALTGWGQDTDRARTVAAGFDWHLVKPVDALTLERVLASAARRA